MDQIAALEIAGLISTARDLLLDATRLARACVPDLVSKLEQADNKLAGAEVDAYIYPYLPSAAR